MIYMVTFLYNLKDKNKYIEYGKKARKIVEYYGGRFMIASHERFEITSIEGLKPDIVNVAVFPSKEKYLSFYESVEYQEVMQERLIICDSQIIMLEKK